MRASLLLALALALLAATGLTACGGGGSSTASTTSTAAASDTSASATTAPQAGGASGKSGGGESSSPDSSSGSSGASSHNPNSKGSASFRAPTADNSIPNFGAESATSDRSRAEATVGAYLHARAKAEWGRACVYLAASTQTKIEQFAGGSKRKLGCAQILAALSRGPAAARADTFTHGLASMRIKGKSGFALFYGPHSQQYVMPMVNEGGAWKIGELAPIAYPLGSETTAP